MGTREGALILLFGLVSMRQDQALAYSILILFVGSILFSSLGFLCYLLKPIQLKGLFKKESNTKTSSKTLNRRPSLPLKRKTHRTLAKRRR